MNQAAMNLEQLLDAHLAGEHPVVLATLESEVAQALAGHRALEGLFLETCDAGDTDAGDRQPPQLSDDYHVERELGRGGMGVVYLVRQKSLNRYVALKVLRPGQQTFGPLLHRFLGEAQHLARLRHPHIVSIHEIGDAQGEPYFTMDYVEGEPLSAMLRRGPLPPTQAVGLLKQIADAVQYAHRQGIIHRDLKPSNVLLDAHGHAFVTDFGLARDLNQAAHLTGSGDLLGTPQYMAPEQARGQGDLIGEATDVHALGMLLYEMLLGRSPFASVSPADTLVRLLHDEPQPPRTIDRRIPRDLETICLKMLAKMPRDRYANVSALLEDLRRYEAGEPLMARRSSWLSRMLRWSRRHRKMATAVAAATMLTTVIFLVVAPRLFDKSYEELVAWANEERADGNPETALRVYARAWRRADSAQRVELAPRIARTCNESSDPQAVVALALPLLEVAPEISFGKYDYLVAQALAMRVRAASPNGAIESVHASMDKPHPDLPMLKARLEIALHSSVAGALSAEQRAEAEHTLEAVNFALGQQQSWVRVTASQLARLPTGDADELRAAADDINQPVWNRGKSALALGKLLEQQRQTSQALTAYRQAADLLRQVYPTVMGVKAAIGSRLSRVDAPDAEECGLVRDAVAAMRRLDPKTQFNTGAVEFAVTGVRLPATIGVDLQVQLCDPAIADPHAGLEANLPRLVPLQQDAPVRLEVLDGTYRLRARGHHARWEPSAERFSRLLQVDIEDWPEQIEVCGGVVRLPPVRLRLADEMKLLAPADRSSIDLGEAEFRWQPVAGATRYVIQLSYTTETPTPTQVSFLFPESTEPRLRFTDLSAADQRLIHENLLVGRTGEWNASAYDGEGRCIGRSLVKSRFLVARGGDTNDR